MKEILSDIIKIVENNNGEKSTTEKALQEYQDNNKDKIEVAKKNTDDVMNEAMKEVTDPKDFTAIMTIMFTKLEELAGKENLIKIQELENKYPFLKNVTDKIFPKK